MRTKLVAVFHQTKSWKKEAVLLWWLWRTDWRASHWILIRRLQYYQGIQEMYLQQIFWCSLVMHSYTDWIIGQVVASTIRKGAVTTASRWEAFHGWWHSKATAIEIGGHGYFLFEGKNKQWDSRASKPREIISRIKNWRFSCISSEFSLIMESCWWTPLLLRPGARVN
jgi:hypothetical protein